MARLPRLVLLGFPYHVTQRGNRRLQTFFADADYAIYRDLLSKVAVRANAQIWAYCLMPNHVHMIVVPSDEDGLRRTFAEAHRRYTGGHQRPASLDGAPLARALRRGRHGRGSSGARDALRGAQSGARGSSSARRTGGGRACVRIWRARTIRWSPSRLRWSVTVISVRFSAPRSLTTPRGGVFVRPKARGVRWAMRRGSHRSKPGPVAPSRRRSGNPSRSKPMSRHRGCDFIHRRLRKTRTHDSIAADGR